MDKEIAETVEDEKTWEVTWGTFGRELKKEGSIAAPMVAVSVLQYLLQFVSMIMVGHLDQLSLSSVAIAISLTNVTGFSLLVSHLSSSSSPIPHSQLLFFFGFFFSFLHEINFPFSWH